MKFSISISTVIMATLLSAGAEMRDVVSHEELVLSQRKAAQNDPLSKFTPTTGADPSVVNKPKDLIADSDILCFNGMVTLVPKRAVLQMPKNLASRLKYIPGAKLMTWADFYSVNRGWITTVEVSRAQAEGNSPLPEETLKTMEKSQNLIVATYQAGPISVLPLKVAAEKGATVEVTAQKPKP
ncbi:MAG: hypothetical protein ACRDBP_11345 [Luteolibacter sp.]